MRFALFIIIQLSVIWVFAQDEDAVVNECLNCHIELDGELALPAKMFSQDIHSHIGFTCADCHGGDPTTDDFDDAKDEDRGFIGIPRPTEIPRLCGKCHNDPTLMRRYNPNIPVDQEAKYWTSQHGISLKKGIVDVATCASCHGIHGILPKNDSRSKVYPKNVAATCTECHSDQSLMEKFHLPAVSYDDYALSVHGEAVLDRGDFSAPTCNDCHGNHAAMPPDVVSVKMVCGVCHVNNFELFRKSKMSQVFEMRGLHGCEVCHSNHRILHPTDEKVSVEKGGVCIKCHKPGDKGYSEAQTMHSALIKLKKLISKAERSISEAEMRGMDIGEALFDIQSAKDVLIRSRTMVHTFNAKEVQRTAAPGTELAIKAFEKGRAALGEFRVRRVWLGTSTFFITFLVIVLFIYIKNIEKH